MEKLKQGTLLLGQLQLQRVTIPIEMFTNPVPHPPCETSWCQREEEAILTQQLYFPGNISIRCSPGTFAPQTVKGSTD